MTPSAEAVVRIAEVLDVTTDYLLVETSPRRSPHAPENILGDRLAVVPVDEDRPLARISEASATARQCDWRLHDICVQLVEAHDVRLKRPSGQLGHHAVQLGVARSGRDVLASQIGQLERGEDPHEQRLGAEGLPARLDDERSIAAALDRELADYFGMPDATGVLVNSVVSGVASALSEASE